MTDTPETTALAVEPYNRAAGLMLQLTQSIQIKCQQDLDDCGRYLREFTKAKKALEEKRSEIVDPMKAAIARVEDLFRSPRESLAKTIADLKGKITDYTQRIEVERVTAMQSAEPAPAPAVAPVGISSRTSWRCEIVDPTAVPRAFFTIDLALVQAAVNAGAREIPGVRVYQHTIQVVR